MKNNANLESGVVMNLQIVKFRKVKSNEFSNYRGKVDVIFSFEMNGQVHNTPITAAVSSLAGYWFYTNPERYVGQTFSSRNTSPDSAENPFMLVKSMDKYYLYMVWEGGKRYVDVVMPGGIIIKKIEPIYKSRQNFVRYLDADSLRKPKPVQSNTGDLRHKQGSGGYSIPVSSENPNAVKPATAEQAFSIDIVEQRETLLINSGYSFNSENNDWTHLNGNVISHDNITTLKNLEWNNLIAK